ncbi:acylphosphatase [bacterium]|jgi:acylphosphatase|nr:acylphosphatase [bacterium]
MTVIQKHIRITGRVQGVFFRVSTQEKAIEIGVAGWVRNNPDGSVESLIQGCESGVNALVEWCHSGSANAQVQQVQFLSPTQTCLNPLERFTIES